ncbi:MAG: hypothetical protein RTU63_13020 [Candidatus Thorarchaeota archaeon]
MRNKVPFILCIIGGALMISASVVGSAGIWEDIILLAQSLAPGFADIMQWVLVILLYIASLGGIAVIIGGYLVTTDRVGTGKFIIGIAAGLGIFGLIMSVYTMYMAVGFAAFTELYNLLSTSAGALGPVLTIVARFMVKKPE